MVTFEIIRYKNIQYIDICYLHTCYGLFVWHKLLHCIKISSGWLHFYVYKNCFKNTIYIFIYLCVYRIISRIISIMYLVIWYGHYIIMTVLLFMISLIIYTYICIQYEYLKYTVNYNKAFIFYMDQQQHSFEYTNLLRKDQL